MALSLALLYAGFVEQLSEVYDAYCQLNKSNNLFKITGFVSAFHVFICSGCLVKLWCPSFKKKNPEISGAQYFFCFMLMEVWIIV